MFLRATKKVVILLLLVMIGLSQGAVAAPFIIFDTGVDGSGNPLTTLGTADPHYTGTFSATLPGVQTGFTVRTTGDAPFTAKNNVAAGGHMRVNNNTGDGATAAVAGFYRYTTTFDLTGFLPGTATITGGVSSNNSGPGSIFLNGVDTGIVFNGSTLTAFSIPNTANFIAGVNTLTFLIHNQNLQNHGLLVAGIQGDAVAVPELNLRGGFLPLMVLGLLALAAGSRRPSIKTSI